MHHIHNCCPIGNQSALNHLNQRVNYTHERSYPQDHDSSHQMWSTKHQYFACIMPKCGIRNWLHIIWRQHVEEGSFEGEFHEKAALGDGASRPNDGLFNWHMAHIILPFDEGLITGLFARISIKDDSPKAKTEAQESAARAVINDPSFFHFAACNI